MTTARRATAATQSGDRFDAFFDAVDDLYEGFGFTWAEHLAYPTADCLPDHAARWLEAQLRALLLEFAPGRSRSAMRRILAAHDPARVIAVLGRGGNGDLLAAITWDNLSASTAEAAPDDDWLLEQDLAIARDSLLAATTAPAATIALLVLISAALETTPGHTGPVSDHHPDTGPDHPRGRVHTLIAAPGAPSHGGRAAAA